MKSGIRSFGLAVAFVLVGLLPAPSYADSCNLLDSGQVRPQFMRDRLPACGGMAPTPAFALATSGSLTTLFASNNGGAATGGIYFDLAAVGTDNVTVTSWDTNLNSTFTGDVSVWYRPGTFSGFETSSAGWTLVGTATGVVSAGNNQPTPLNVGTLVIPAGTTYGIAITLSPTGGSSGHEYTNGTGSNQVYNDGVLQLTAGSANNTAFSSSIFTPRVWNGTIHYNVANAVVVPTPAVDKLGLAALFMLLAGIAIGILRRRGIT